YSCSFNHHCDLTFLSFVFLTRRCPALPTLFPYTTLFRSVLVAALNIVSGLIMLVKDKGSDIAILRTMGASSGAVMRIFFMTGAEIGRARLNSSHVKISYAVFCLKKKKKNKTIDS